MAPERPLPKEPERLARILQIGVDIDCTIFNLVPSSKLAAEKRFGIKIEDERVSDYWFLEEILKGAGIPEKERRLFYQDIYRSSENAGVYLDSPPMPGAIEVLRKLHQQGHEIFVLTSRSAEVLPVVEQQFVAQGINWVGGLWPEGNIIIRNEDYWPKKGPVMVDQVFKLHAIRGDFPYGRYQNFPGLDYHLDDQAGLLGHDLSLGVKERIIILSWSYNREIVPETNLVENWWAFERLIQDLARVEKLSLELPNVAQS